MNSWLNWVRDRLFGNDDMAASETEDSRFTFSEFVREPNNFNYGLFGESSSLHEEIPNRDLSDVVIDWLDEIDCGRLRR